MFADVERRIDRKNKILFTRESACLQALKEQISRQSRLTLVLWAFDCLRIPVSELVRRYPDETDIPQAYTCCLAWAHAEVKMPVAKRAILDCHAAAKRMTCPADIALCHAVGQGCASVHVETHALGLAFYELTAMVIRHGWKDYEAAVTKKIDFYQTRLAFWQAQTPAYRDSRPWADFLLRPGRINPEKSRAHRS